ARGSNPIVTHRRNRPTSSRWIPNAQSRYSASMPRLKHTIDVEDGADSSFSPNDSDLIDSADEDEDSGSDTEATDIELSDNPDDEDENGAVEQQAALFDGNAHPIEYYRQGIEEFDEDDFDDGYAPGTREQLDSLEDEWRRFCTSILRSDAKTCFRSVTAAKLYKFFDWRLNQKIGRGGRKKKGTKKESSLETGWKCFR
ncbi:hypothetical protein GE09DRAFT_1267713, partial [Coniochaeta sp. 2T2.1]